MLRRANAMVILICASSEGFREGWVWYSRPPSHASEKPQLFSLTPSSLPKGTETRSSPQHRLLISTKKGGHETETPPRAPRARHFAKFFKFSFSDIEPNCACFSSTINQGRCYSRGRCTDTHQGQETLRNSLNLLSRKCSHISHHATYYQICQVLLPFLGNSFTPAF